MTLTRCALCNDVITNKNDSKEHVIPNAIGGRLKVSKVICRVCNSDSGEKWDSELAKQLNPLSLFFGINRVRGNVPSQTFKTTKGKEIKLHSNGTLSNSKPDYKESIVNSVVNINIQARTRKEAKKLIEGVKRKYPQADIDHFLQNLEDHKYYLNDAVNFNISFGGHDAGRSIVKTAISFAVKNGINIKLCNLAITYLQENGSACWGYYYQNDLVINRPPNEVLHYLGISGNPKTGLLLCYLEYFGIYKMVVCLSDKYSGDFISNSYSINPITGKEFDIKIDINLTPKEIEETYSYNMIPDNSIETAISKVVSLGQKRSYELEKERVITDAVGYAFRNCGASEGSALTEDQLNRLSGLIWERMEPFILSRIKR